MASTPLGVSLDHLGPIAASVQDAAWIWSILAGRDGFAAAVAAPAALRLRQLVGYFVTPARAGGAEAP